MLHENQRRQVVEVCRRMQAEGLVVGTAGNVSVRVGDDVVISPSGVAYDSMTPADVVVVDLGGAPVDGTLKPSSEVPLHLSVYRATDVGAITHNHAPASTALSVVVDEIPATHYYSGMFGGPVRVAPYATFGTDELADNVTAALDGRTGALMSNHGAITTGADLPRAFALLPYLEYICEVQLRALATGLRPKVLSPELLAEAGHLLGSYGQASTGATTTTKDQR